MSEYDRLKAIKAKVLAKRAKPFEAVYAALEAHHEWHLAQTDPDQHGTIPAEAYEESALYDQTVAALAIKDTTHG